MAQLKVTDAVLGYEGHPVLSELNFEVQSGEYLCILGENGAGKSTLMRTILGLLPMISGSIEFGEGLSRREIGYLPQATVTQRDFPASVREIVRSGCLNRMNNRPFYSAAEKALAEESMAKLGITDLSARCFRELSGGQQQRVLLSRALCATRKMLLLDEPVSGLDPSAAEEMYELIDMLHTEEKITIIMISHDLPSALRYAEKILYIGKPFFFGTKEEYLQSGRGGVK